ncbi:hypothetical protein [Vibrio sp. Y58_MX_L22]|uniref:hypothetical protein n=1 Tax=Vibrio sp. Y58_MX_L22 TaxID=2957763 RepID=UPI0020A2A000|nr:hypothetical protein [Vibrio sp. Y58_MX_L22]
MNNEFRDFLLHWEGTKRLESFISEQYFQKSVENYFGREFTSFDWFRCTYDYGKKSIFVRFLGRNYSKNMSKADIALIREFIEKKETVVIARYDESGEFKAYKAKLNLENKKIGSSIFDDAAELLCQLSMHNNLKQSSPAKNKLAETDAGIVTYLQEGLSSKEQTSLLLTRRFIYEVLYPAFHNQPNDIDAVVLSKGEIKFLEFKRKDPAQSYFTTRLPLTKVKSICKQIIETEDTTDVGELRTTIRERLKNSVGQAVFSPSYGIDQSHTKFIRWCHSNNMGYYLIHLNAGKTLSSKFINLQLNHLTKPVSFSYKQILSGDIDGFNFTIGEDSGMNPYTRIQETIRADKFKKLEQAKKMDSIFEMIK